MEISFEAKRQQSADTLPDNGSGRADEEEGGQFAKVNLLLLAASSSKTPPPSVSLVPSQPTGADQHFAGSFRAKQLVDILTFCFVFPLSKWNENYSNRIRVRPSLPAAEQFM